MQEKLRNIPKIHDLLEDPALEEVLGNYDRSYLHHHLTEIIDEIRAALLQGRDISFTKESILGDLKNRISSPYILRTVLNATGIVLHTNLGRAPLSEAAIQRMTHLARSYNNLEFDLEAGKRGSRYHHLRRHLQYLTGAEDAHIVNNNAAAVFLVLHTFAREKEVILSRGEMIEIGESFRIPDIMRLSGARLVEVGTTNRTHLADYENAITEETGMLMKVHPSNYYVGGFSQQVDAIELKDLATRYDLPVFEDVGSGSLLEEGLFREKNSVREAYKHVDLLSFSGDKLLGGPQAGIILGSKERIHTLKKSQLTRVLRVDKLTLGALEATLLDYSKKEELPIYYFLNRSFEELEKRSESMLELFKEKGIEGEIVMGEGLVGGGALPQVSIRSPKIALALGKEVERISLSLRRRAPAVVGVIQDGHLLLDLRCIYPDEEALLLQAILEECQ